MTTQNLPGPDHNYRVIHRIFYIGVGKSRLEKAQEIIDSIRKNIKRADAEKGIPVETFLDIYIPIWGENAPTRVEFSTVDLLKNQFGKFEKLEDHD